MTLRPLACVVVAGLFGVVTAAPAGAQAEPVMEKSEAAAYYLAAACALNAANHRFHTVLLGDNRVTKAEVARRLPTFKRESRRLAPALNEFARALNNPPAAWPESIDGNVFRLANMDARQANVRREQGHVHSAVRWVRLHLRAERIHDESVPALIRERLDLPAPPPTGEHC